MIRQSPSFQQVSLSNNQNNPPAAPPQPQPSPRDISDHLNISSSIPKPYGTAGHLPLPNTQNRTEAGTLITSDKATSSRSSNPHSSRFFSLILIHDLRSLQTSITIFFLLCPPTCFAIIIIPSIPTSSDSLKLGC